MSDEKVRAKGASEYATKENEVRPRRRTSFFFKFLGLLIVLLAAWIGWYSYRQGTLPDLTNETQQKKMLEQAKKDLVVAEEKATEASKQFVSWAKINIEDLRKRIKGNPPETKEDISNLVNESRREVSVEKGDEVARADKPAAKKVEEKKPSKADQLVAEAREHYRTGLGAYAQTDPSGDKTLIQNKLHEAEPHFVKCLDLLEQARALGASGPDIDTLEQSAARRLYDCRKRMVLRV